MNTYSIMLADDHVLFRQGVKKIIEEVEGLKIVGEANDGLELLELMKKRRPDLVILDISMPNLRVLEAAREIKTLYPQVKVLLLTMHKEKALPRGRGGGRRGRLPGQGRRRHRLLQAVEAIKKGQKFFSPLLSEKLADLVRDSGKPSPLTRREKEIVKLLAEGKNSKQIAELRISASTPCAATGTISCASLNSRAWPTWCALPWNRVSPPISP